MTDATFVGLIYASLAAAAIPVGALLARVESLYPDWLTDEYRHGIIAFGGGALLSAVALVLVPDGAERFPGLGAIVAFVAGGVIFALLDWWVARAGGGGGQLLAMLSDFIPECIALGALLAGGEGAALLLAIMIALQNLPEGFNAYREMCTARDLKPKTVLLSFFGIALLGPVAAWIGMTLLSEADAVLGALMLFASGGILYIVFQDIAPQARLEMSRLPPFGAVLGFALGLAGHVLLHG